MTSAADTAIVASAIQRTYQDATQTELDLQAARAVLADLRAVGWLSPDEVAAIIVAAGGVVKVTDRIQEDVVYRNRYEIRSLYSPETFTTTIQARVKQ